MASRCFALAAPVGALLFMVSTAVAQRGQPGGPECRHLNYRTNFRLNGAQQYLNQARDTRFEDDRRRHIASAARVLNEAAQVGGADPLTLWYFFGITYALQGDLVGADSAWRRAEALADPDCRLETARRRRNEWVPLFNGAGAQMSENNPDSALALLRRAHIIYRDDPSAYINMAHIFVDRNATDSAIAYYRLAASAGEEARTAGVRAGAAFNAARVAHRAGTDSAIIAAEVARRPWPDTVPAAARHATVRDRFLGSAETLYREYLRVRPRDIEAMTGLAGVLGSLRRAEEASAIYDSILAYADSVESFDLFEAGVALFRQGRYAQAARAFEAGLAGNPSHRDALFNLANTYLAGQDTARVLVAAHRLVAVDSMNRQSLQLLAAAYQRHAAGNNTRDSLLRARRDTAAVTFRRLAAAYRDSTLRTLLRRDSLPWEITVQRFQPRDSSASIRGAVQNLEPRERRGFVLVLEFVTGANEVVATERVDIPDLAPAGQPGSAYDFSLTVSGRGLIAYRYRVT